MPEWVFKVVGILCIVSGIPLGLYSITLKIVYLWPPAVLLVGIGILLINDEVD